jgi:23S rRNA (guanosine2251-2'-O)-methyltransferase
MSHIIYGKNAVLEAFKSDLDIEKVFILQSVRGELEIAVRHFCKEKNIPLAKVPESKINDLARDKAHQGVVAITSPVKYVDYSEMISQVPESGSPLFVVLDSVTDVRNIGAIARSALFFGAHGLIISGSASGRINEETVKASSGAILNLPVARASSIFNLISDLQSGGIQVVATGLKATQKPHETDFTIPTALIMGSEDKGLHPKIYQVADHHILIPGSHRFDSLNVSVATGILLYEVQKQRFL